MLIHEIKKYNEWVHPKSKPDKRKWIFIFSDGTQVKVPFSLLLIVWDATVQGTNEVLSCQALLLPSAAAGLLRGSKRFALLWLMIFMGANSFYSFAFTISFPLGQYE